MPADYNKNRITPSKTKFGSAQPSTPVRNALNTVAQLKSVLRQASDEPTSKLKEYFQKCSTNVTVPIANRLKGLKETFVSKFASMAKTSQRSVAEQRVTMATRLYYQVMESMLNMEHERLSQNDFSSLLSHENFHRSLLAACVEIILMTYGLSPSHSKGSSISYEDSPFSFPWILEVIDLQAYDFFKVLESFIKAEPKLPGDVIRHLQSVEHRILDSIVWREVLTVRLDDRGPAWMALVPR
ncbi:retinoblastoma-associated protein-like [Gigantopelta aegis]|uniref:retinoblastoma-associated protein-like n=1 Tax=Gigantopelta aegis TaxID=1735272 RepID=UPI001B8875A4|nr:retinoblastoma-associated protein-like [Gigantopelta aegis]